MTDDSETVTDGGSGAGSDDGPANGSDENGRADPADAVNGQWKDDLVMIGKLVAVTYVAFGVLGLVAGLSTNEIAGFLETVTFYAAVFALVTLALNLHWGYTGLFNIGVAGFMAVGVYTMAVLTASPDASPAGLGLPIFVGVIGGVLAAAAAGAVLSLPALRVRADYFAIITLGFSEIVRLTITSGTLRTVEIGDTVYGTGGGSGIGFPPVDSVIDWLFGAPVLHTFRELLYDAFDLLAITSSVVDRLLYAAVIIGFVIVVYLLLDRISQSPFGRILKAIREDEIVPRSLGKNTQYAKIKVFTLGCGLMGLAGILWMGSRSFAQPESFLPIVTFYIFVALIVGGAGSNTGSVVGGFAFAAFLYEGPRYVRTIMRANLDTRSPPTIYDAVVELGSLDPMPLVGYFVGSLDELRWILVGVVLVVLMIYRPEGLLGDRKEIAAATDLSVRPDGRESARADGGESDE